MRQRFKEKGIKAEKGGGRRGRREGRERKRHLTDRKSEKAKWDTERK